MELGGANYNGMEPKSYDADGRELPGSGGYKYFGAAKELPGVRERFQAEAPAPPRRTRGDMYKNITPDYYGYRDEDDGVLVRKEAAAEKRGIVEEVERHEVSTHRCLLTGKILNTLAHPTRTPLALLKPISPHFNP